MKRGEGGEMRSEVRAAENSHTSRGTWIRDIRL